jgi:hypothetical protein
MGKHCSSNFNVPIIYMLCLYDGENITPQCHDVYKIALIKMGLYLPYLSEKLIQV